jgi:hypothetical protein
MSNGDLKIFCEFITFTLTHCLLTGVLSSVVLNVIDMLKFTFNLFVSFLQYLSISTFFILLYFDYWIFFFLKNL